MAHEKIVCVDDEQGILDLIAQCLRAEGMSVMQTRKGLETLSLVVNHPCDLLILDLCLKDSDGFEVLKEVRSQSPHLPVIILSARQESYNKVLGLGLGADDYVTKPFVGEELVARVKAVLRRAGNRQAAAGGEIVQGIFRLDLRSLKLYKQQQEIALPARVLKLFRFFMENAGCTLSHKQIYAHVWDDNYFDSDSLMVYIRKLRKLIEDDPGNPRFIRTVWGIGYKFEPS